MALSEKIITTNLRIPENDWRQLKSVSAQAGMSMNEYLNLIIREHTQWYQLQGNTPLKKKGYSLWDITSVTKDLRPSPEDFSENDEIIYGC